jgi:hypothetical protein
MTNPAPPPGFVLDQAPPPPPGFVLDGLTGTPPKPGAPRVKTDTEQLLESGQIPSSWLPFLEPVEQGLRSARQGVSFGFADELAGLGGGAKAFITGGDFGSGYTSARDRERALSGQFEQDHPGASLAGNLGGGLLTGLGPAKAAAAPLNFLSRAYQSAKTGAAVGGLAGFGVGEGDANSQLASTGRGAATGAILAPVVTAGLQGASLLGRLIPRRPVTQTVNVPGATPPPAAPAGSAGATPNSPPATTPVQVTTRDRALDLVGDTLRRSGQTAEGIEQQLVRNDDLPGKPEILADFLGDQGSRRLYTTRTLGGPEASAAVERLATRGEGTAARVSEDVQQATSQRGQSLTQLEARIDNRRRMGNTLYTEAFKHGAVTDPDTIALVQNPRVSAILKKASDRRQQVADLRGETYAPLFRETDQGPVLARVPTVEDLHLLKTSLDDDIQQAFKAGEGQLGKALRDFKNQIVGKLEDEVPAYRKARQTYKGDAEIEEAITNGRADILRKPVDELRRDFNALSGAEQDAYRSGAIDTILARKVDPKVDSADFARSLWGNADSRNRLQLLVKDEAELVRLARQFEREQRIARTNRGVLGGSPTAMRATDIEDQTAQTLADVATQGPQGAFVSTVGRWIRRAGGLTEAVADDVAKLLTAENPDTIRAVLQSLKGREQVRVLQAMSQQRAAQGAASASAQQTNGKPK